MLVCWIKKISKQKRWQWHDNDSLLMILQSIQTCPKNCEFNWTRMISLACCWCVIYMCSERTITNEHYITKRYVLLFYSIAMLYTVQCVLLPRTYYACRIVKAGVDRIIWAACVNTTPNISLKMWILFRRFCSVFVRWILNIFGFESSIRMYCTDHHFINFVNVKKVNV